MDAKKQHEFVGGNSEDLSRSMYCNVRKIQNNNIPPHHTQYYLQDRTSSVSMERNKPCRCAAEMSNNIQCKGCCNDNNSIKKTWNAMPVPSHMNMSYTTNSMESEKHIEKSPYYIHSSNVSPAPYWSEKSSFPEEPLMANKLTLEPMQNCNLRAYGKVYSIEQPAYKTPPQPQVLPLQQSSQTKPQPQHIRPPVSVEYCQERYYDDKYSYNNNDAQPLNVMYAPSSSSSVSPQRIDIYDPEKNTLAVDVGLRRTTTIATNHPMSHQINNESTSHNNNNEQHQNPNNYLKKFQTICTLDNQGSTYSNLYMSAPPQFSSEKFSSVQNEKNDEFLTHPHNTDMSQHHHHHRSGGESLKMCESPLRPSSSPLPFTTTRNKYNQDVKEQFNQFLPPQSSELHHGHDQHPHQHATFSRHTLATAPRSVQCFSSQATPKDHHANDALICKDRNQTYDHYQYLRNSNPLPLPPTNMAPIKVVSALPTTDYNCKEETSMNSRVAISSSSSGSGNGLYLNPYNTPPTILPTTCCKEPSPLPKVISNFRHDSSLATSKCTNNQTFVENKSILQIAPNSSQMYTSTPSAPVSTPPLVASSSSPHNYLRRQKTSYDLVHSNCLKRPATEITSNMMHSQLPQFPAPSHMLPTSHQFQQQQQQKVYNRQQQQQQQHSQHCAPAPAPAPSYSQQTIDKRQQKIPKISRSKNLNNIRNTAVFDSQFQPPPQPQPPPTHITCFSGNDSNSNSTLQTTNTTALSALAITNANTNAGSGNISVSSTVNHNQSSAHMKKLQTTKPNYRELIKQVHAMRSAEDELNLQIIKKTMNVDARFNRTMSADACATGKIWTRPQIAENNKSPELINTQSSYRTSSSTACKQPSAGMPMAASAIRTERTTANNLSKTMHHTTSIDEKTSSSPLDLSMRTVKTKADSTEFKYQQNSAQIPRQLSQTSTNTNAQYTYALPRVEFTPNFSLHTVGEINQHKIIKKCKIPEPLTEVRDTTLLHTTEEVVVKRIPINETKIEHLQFPNHKQQTNELEPTWLSSSRSSTPTTKAKSNQVLYETAFYSTQSNNELQAVSTNAENIKKPTTTTTSSAKQSIQRRQEIWQVRPSVLESNPYANPKVLANEQKQKTVTRTLPTMNVLPPDTNIMPLVKTFDDSPPSDCVTTNQSPTISKMNHAELHQILPVTVRNDNTKLNVHETVQTSLINVDSKANESSTCFVLRGPEKKCALDDFEVMRSRPTQLKQMEFKNEIPSPIVVVEGNQHTKTPVIAVNENIIRKTMQEQQQQQEQKTSYQHQEQATPTIIHIEKCKIEPVSPTTPQHHHSYPLYVPTTANIKNENSSLIMAAARIRTKGELKGFTFTPPPITITKNAETTMPSTKPPPPLPLPPPPSCFQIKEEFMPTIGSTTTSMPSIPELNDDFNKESLLDFGWSSACNNFVEQLLSNPKSAKTNAKKRSKPADADLNEANLSNPESNSNTHTNIKIKRTNSPTDDRSLLAVVDLDSYRIDSQFINIDSIHSTTHDVSSMAQLLVHQKKISKIGRDKLRVNQERRFAARLQEGSSSETEIELDRRHTERLKKPFKKYAKSRASSTQQRITKNRFSDCGSDSSGSITEDLRNKEQLLKCSKKSNELDKGHKGKGVVVVPKINLSTEKFRYVQNTVESCASNEKGLKINEAAKLQSKKLKVLKTSHTSSSTSSSSSPEQGQQQQQKSKFIVRENEKLDFSTKLKLNKNHETNKALGRKPVSSSSSTKATQAEIEKNKKKKKATAAAVAGVGGTTRTEQLKRKTLNHKSAQNTVTRSKRKRELELQLANSKVLRNEKVIRNSTATQKIKRKYTKKYPNQSGGSLNKNDTLNNQLIMSTRLRTRRHEKDDKANERKSLMKKKKSSSTTTTTTNNKKHSSSTNNTSTNNMKTVGRTTATTTKTTGTINDGPSELLLEVYRYKRSLKIPPSLITLKHPSNNKIEGTLSDFETETIAGRKHSNSQSTSTFSKVSMKSKGRGVEGESKNLLAKKSKSLMSKMALVPPTATPTVTAEQPRSIIDVLHSRVLSKSSKTTTTKTKANPFKKSFVTKSGTKIALIEKVNCSENQTTSITIPTSSSAATATVAPVTAELPTLKREEDSDDDADQRKRHFSIFDTKVLQTKTRTESKLQQKREIIREIFVGEERPASAPPEVTPSTEDGGVGGSGGSGGSGGCKKMTYEQKYEQFLQQMNIVVNNTKFCKLSRNHHEHHHAATTTATTANGNSLEHIDAFNSNFAATLTEIKQEEDTESASAIDIDADVLQADNASIASTGGPIQHNNNVKRKRSGKYFRRKGSSGFDYIRKKKKNPTVYNTTATSQQHHLYMSPHHKSYTKSEAADYKFKEKTEDDVCREIQKWVLNKGVGQSTMHKAARLGYIDVIVYCLDRLCLNPDQKDNAGYTPLHEACTNGWLEIAKILLQFGAKHSEAAHSGIRPLHEASENDHEELVRLLLSYGADPLLATYSGQTPLMLASSAAVRDLLRNHLHDVQYVGIDRKPWKFEGPWAIFDATENGCDVLYGAPGNNCDMSRALCRNFGTNLTLNKNICNQYEETKSKDVLDKCCTELLDNTTRSLNSIRLFNTDKPEIMADGNNSDIESDVFEFEEADVLLPPLYLLNDEGTQKWVLLSDLCNLLKVKSKDTLLNKIYPSSSVSPVHRDYIKELKMSEFLKKATCLQLLCAGEKINICASKVVLIKYNENVRDLLGVKTILMKF